MANPESALPLPGYAAMRDQATVPGQQRFLFHCGVGRSERRADWIAPARRHRSGLNGHEDVEHCRDSICASRSSPTTQEYLRTRATMTPYISRVSWGRMGE